MQSLIVSVKRSPKSGLYNGKVLGHVLEELEADHRTLCHILYT